MDIIWRIRRNFRKNPTGYGDENETKERAVCDYIAGMTDIYAIDRFKELFIRSLERIRRKKCIIRKR